MNGNLRLRYSKTGRARYISHLDLMATMRRALRRAGVELKYSEGFNPHPYMSVALPLPVGSSSVCELMDIGVAADIQEDAIPGRINAVLPEGIKVLEAYAPERKFSGIAWVEIRGALCCAAGTSLGDAERMEGCFAAERIIIMKKTKRGENEIDIAPFIKDVRMSHTSHNGEVTMSARLSAQNPSITAEDLLGVLRGGPIALAPDYYDLSRIEVFDKDMKVFR